MKLKSFFPEILRTLAMVLAVCLFAAACASKDDGGDFDDDGGDDFGYELPDDNDPLETPNRFIFAVNDALDTLVFQPVAATYRFLLPEFARNSVQSFFRNLRAPVNLANNLLQGDWEGAEQTMGRFAINTSFGVLGLFDMATDAGYPYREEDFGQTLGTYGVGEGFYLVLPIFGPSSLRDGTGRLVDWGLDPLSYILTFEESIARRAIEGTDTRSRNIETIEALKADSIDFYARVRSLYRQNREDEINNGRPAEEVPSPDFSSDEDS
ncbi:MAG: VacJ family lipoprotein [Pseudomonadota bacterium]